MRTSSGEIPLSTYLAAIDLPEVLLLKVLDPKPAAVLGDLYFEVHEEKREVYVVTGIDDSAWPDGRGQIRFGLDQAKRQAFAGDSRFRAAYLDAIADYEEVRRAIDEQGESRTEDEAEARRNMDSFTATRDLQVGDVIAVPTWTPHALQHGVRVVEFQTPVYERLIVSFAQEVLTQNHWDSQRAVEHMHLDPPALPEFEAVGAGIERIARFDDFNVWRVDGGIAGSLVLDPGLPYAIVMNLSGDLTLGNLKLGPEEAALMPSSALTTRLAGGTFLIAAPHL